MPRPLGIRSQLLGLVAAAAVPFLLLIVVALWNQYRTVQAESLERAYTEARVVAAQIDDHLGNLENLTLGLSHAIGLTPDESELWIGDAINKQLVVFDNEGQDNWKLDMSKALKLDHSADWITMGLDGKRALLSSGDVVDVKTHKIVGKLRDEYGHLIHSEKFLDVQFNDKGHVTRVVDQFANGQPAAVKQRTASR